MQGFQKTYKYKKAAYDENENKYSKLIKNLENNEIGVNKITNRKFIGY